MSVARVGASEYCSKTGADNNLADKDFKYVLVDNSIGFKVHKASGELTTDNLFPSDDVSVEQLMSVLDKLDMPVDHYCSEARDVTSLSEKISNAELGLEKEKRYNSITNAIIILTTVFVAALISILVYVLVGGVVI